MGGGRGSRVLNVVLVVILLVGIGLLIYPTFSDWWNLQHQTRAIVNYDSTVADMEAEETAAMLAAAVAYNEWLYESNHGLGLDDDELEEYESILDVTGTGIMGYIEIEKIDVYLPIYHTTSAGRAWPHPQNLGRRDKSLFHRPTSVVAWALGQTPGRGDTSLLKRTAGRYNLGAGANSWLWGHKLAQGCVDFLKSPFKYTWRGNSEHAARIKPLDRTCVRC